MRGALSSLVVSLLHLAPLVSFVVAEEEPTADVAKVLRDKPWLGTFFGCLIWQPSCERHADAQLGYFLDDFEGSASNETRCMLRASEYHAWCGNYFTNRTVAVFLESYSMEVFPPFGCAVFQRSCPQIQEAAADKGGAPASAPPTRQYDGVFFDDFEGAFGNESKCLHRSVAYRAWCHPVDSPEWVAAIYAPSAVVAVASEALPFSGATTDGRTVQTTSDVQFNSTVRTMWTISRASPFADTAVSASLFELAGLYLDCRSPPLPLVDGTDVNRNIHYNCNGPNAQLAVEALRLHLGLRPRHADAWYNLGVAYYRLTLLDRATNAFAAAVHLDENHSHAVGALATMLTQQGRYADAWAVLEKRVRPWRQYRSALAVNSSASSAASAASTTTAAAAAAAAPLSSGTAPQQSLSSDVLAPELVSWARLSHRFGAAREAVELLRTFISVHYPEKDGGGEAMGSDEKTKQGEEEEETTVASGIGMPSRLSPLDLRQQEANLRFRLAWLLDLLAGQQLEQSPSSRGGEKKATCKNEALESATEGRSAEQQQQEEDEGVAEKERKGLLAKGLRRVLHGVFKRDKAKKKARRRDDDDDDDDKAAATTEPSRRDAVGDQKGKSSRCDEEEDEEDFARAAFAQHRRANQLVLSVDRARHAAAVRAGDAAPEPLSNAEAMAQMAALRMAYCEECVRSVIPSSGWRPGATSASAAAAASPSSPSSPASAQPIIPIFVVGMPRSGTSLVEQMLSMHPAIAAAGELPSLTSLSPRVFLKRGLFEVGGGGEDSRSGQQPQGSGSSETASSSSSTAAAAKGGTKGGGQIRSGIVDATFDPSVTSADMDALAQRFLHVLARHAEIDATATARSARRAASREQDSDAASESASESASSSSSSSGSSRFIVSKLPNHFELIGLIAKLFPGAPVIHTTRDARDTILSNYQTNYQSGHRWSYNLTEAADYFAGYRALMRHWFAVFDLDHHWSTAEAQQQQQEAKGVKAKAVMPPLLNMLTVRYEDVVCDPVGAARQFLGFLGQWGIEAGGGGALDGVAAAALAEVMAQPHMSLRTTHTSSNEQVRRPIYKSSVGRWRQYALRGEGGEGAELLRVGGVDPEAIASATGKFPADAIVTRILGYEPATHRKEALAEIARDLPCGVDVDAKPHGAGDSKSESDESNARGTQAEARWSQAASAGTSVFV